MAPAGARLRARRRRGRRRQAGVPRAAQLNASGGCRTVRARTFGWPQFATVPQVGAGHRCLGARAGFVAAMYPIASMRTRLRSCRRLPEVETVARDLQRWAAGATIRAATVRWDRTIRHPQPPERFAAEIAGATIRRVDRRAKTVLLHLEDGRVMTVALRMTGALIVTPGDAGRSLCQVVFDPGGWSRAPVSRCAQVRQDRVVAGGGPAEYWRGGAAHGRARSRRRAAGTASVRCSAATGRSPQPKLHRRTAEGAARAKERAAQEPAPRPELRRGSG